MKTIEVAFNESLSRKTDEQKPSKWQWVPLAGVPKVLIDHFKRKPTIPDYYRDDEAKIKRIIPELHAMYQGMSAFIFTDLIIKYFS